ncbi:MAG: hypothetical protein ABSH28_04670 [Acidobacteriota bacterium]
MKRCVVLVALIGLYLGSSAWIAKKVNYSGTWLLKQSRTNQSPNMQGGGGGGTGRSSGGMGRGGGRTGRGLGYPGGGMPGGTSPGGRGDTAPVGTGQPEVSTLVIEQTEDKIKVTHQISNSEGGERITQLFKLDGTESVNPGVLGNGEMKSRTSWDKDKIVTVGTQKMASSSRAPEIELKEEFSLSSDGKTLTLKTTQTTPMGRFTSKQVFIKQTEAAK